jgi:alpha-D-ribose 1-methylphosphonate 5-triphosphate synthase subunit PhnI
MGYIAVKGGTNAIEASIERLTYERLKHREVVAPETIRASMRGLIDQVMSEASLYNEEVAALAIKQAEGSPEEAVFILRAFRSTLPRLHYSHEMHAEQMRVERRISATFKDIPGGQILGASYDYTHRLIDTELATETNEDAERWLADWFAQARGVGDRDVTGAATSATPVASSIERLPKVLDYLRKQGLMKPVERDPTPASDVTRDALTFPTDRSQRLQLLTRGQTGTVTSLGYASLRGFGPLLHPTVAELRVGHLSVIVPNPFPDEGSLSDEDDGYYVGEVKVTEVETVVPVAVPRGGGRTEIEFDIGYGIAFGQNETKAIAMSLLDQCLENPNPAYPTHDEEFVLLHIDSVEATGFISHLKLPHYVTFQSDLDSVRKTRQSKHQSTASREVELPGSAT